MSENDSILDKTEIGNDLIYNYFGKGHMRWVDGPLDHQKRDINY